MAAESTGVRMITLGSRAEWLEKRKSYIGGSEAACIVGMNPYQSNVDLWEHKTGRKVHEDISGNPCVAYGTDAEKYLRELFRLDFPQYTVEYVENNLWLNDEYPFAHASLDGWLKDESGRMGILEIKTSLIRNAAMSAKWKDRIPDNYFCQILHYLAVTGFDFVVLKAQLKFPSFNEQVFDTIVQTRHYFVERKEVESDIRYLMEQEKRFAEYIKTDSKPPLVLPRI